MTRAARLVAAVLLGWAAPVVLGGIAPAGAGATSRPTGPARPPIVAVVDTGVAPIAPLVGPVRWEASRTGVGGPNVGDADGHGTAMAVLVHRMAPRARILAIKAFDAAGTARGGTVARAVEAAVERGADVILLSASSPAPSPPLRSALERASERDRTVVTAAGNDGGDLDRWPEYPASYPVPGMIVAAATDGHGRLAAGTGTGRRTVLLGAPGVGIPTCTPDGRVTTVRGSSAAAALVAGAAAAALTADPAATRREVRRAVLTRSRASAALERHVRSGAELVVPPAVLGTAARCGGAAAAAPPP